MNEFKAKDQDKYLLFEMQEMHDLGMNLSPSRLQRKFCIGYNRAAVLMYEFEKKKKR